MVIYWTLEDLKINMENKYYIGIDAGVNTGFALWNKSDKRFIDIDTISFWECIYRLERFKEEYDDITVVIEDVIANKPTFDHNTQNRFKRERISQNVGMNKRDCALIIQYCELNKIDTIRRKPGKYSLTKMDKDKFNKLTGWHKQTSEHGRDAAMLIFGK